MTWKCHVAKCTLNEWEYEGGTFTPEWRKTFRGGYSGYALNLTSTSLVLGEEGCLTPEGTPVLRRRASRALLFPSPLRGGTRSGPGGSSPDLLTLGVKWCYLQNLQTKSLVSLPLNVPILTHLEYISLKDSHLKRMGDYVVPLHLNEDLFFLEGYCVKAPNPITVSLILGKEGCLGPGGARQTLLSIQKHKHSLSRPVTLNYLCKNWNPPTTISPQMVNLHDVWAHSELAKHPESRRVHDHSLSKMRFSSMAFLGRHPFQETLLCAHLEWLKIFEQRKNCPKGRVKHENDGLKALALSHDMMYFLRKILLSQTC